MTYQCPRCGRTYQSPVNLTDPPECSGDKTKHTPATMKEKP